MANLQFAHYIGQIPADASGRQNPRGLFIPATLIAAPAGAALSLDLTRDATHRGLDFAQAVYIDAADLASALTLTCRTNGYRVRARANTQGWYPLACSDQMLFDLSGAAGLVGLTVPLIFTNAPVQPLVWATV